MSSSDVWMCMCSGCLVYIICWSYIKLHYTPRICIEQLRRAEIVSPHATFTHIAYIRTASCDGKVWCSALYVYHIYLWLNLCLQPSIRRGDGVKASQWSSTSPQQGNGIPRWAHCGWQTTAGVLSFRRNDEWLSALCELWVSSGLKCMQSVIYESSARASSKLCVLFSYFIERLVQRGVLTWLDGKGLWCDGRTWLIWRHFVLDVLFNINEIQKSRTSSKYCALYFSMTFQIPSASHFIPLSFSSHSTLMARKALYIV